MMKVSCAEFLGGKEADDAYNKLCERTGVEWDVKRTCTMHFFAASNIWRCSECEGVTYPERTNASPPLYCLWCGAKVVSE